MTESALLSPDATVSRSSELLAAEIDDETVLMSVDKGYYYGLAATAHDIWARLEQPIRVADLTAALAADYDAPAERIADEVLVFLGKLANEGLVVVA